MIFHGSNGGINSITQLEWLAAYNELAKRNVGFVATISDNRIEKVWDHSLGSEERQSFARPRFFSPARLMDREAHPGLTRDLLLAKARISARTI